MANLAMLNGVVDLFVLHEMTEPDIINMIEGVGMEEAGLFQVNDQCEGDVATDIVLEERVVDVGHCVNEGDDHGHGSSEVLAKEGDQGDDDVANEVVLGDGVVDEGHCENDGGDHGQGACKVLAKEGDGGKGDAAIEVVLG